MANEEHEVSQYTSYDALLEDMRHVAPMRVVLAMKQTPREWFLENPKQALLDAAIAISPHENMSSNSQPKVIAHMTGMLDPRLEHHVLEIGTAGGWQGGILSRLAGRVTTIEYLPDLAQQARDRYKMHNLTNIEVLSGDAFEQQWPANYFDRIIITASVPPWEYETLSFAHMLTNKGRVVLPLGGAGGNPTSCDVVMLVNVDGTLKETRRASGFSFVPMEGKRGWTAYIPHAIARVREIFPQEAQELSDEDLTPYAIQTMREVFHAPPPFADIFSR